MTELQSSSLRILYIADSTSVHTQRWIKYFSNAGYEIFIITIGKKKKILSYANHIANFKQFYYNSPSFITNLIKTRRILQNFKPDILHAHFVHQYGWLGALTGFHPFVLTAWGTDILNLPNASRLKFGKWLTQYTLKKADVITVTSEAAKSEVRRLGVLPEKIEVVFWGVDTERFRPDIDSNSLRKYLDIPENSTVILSNRSLSLLYNNDIVITAFAELIKRLPNVDLYLILQNAGGAYNGKAELLKLVREKGIERSVRILPQFDHEDMPSLYAMADIYVSVPSWDAGPVSLKEAMACGCTPVISRLDGPMEWVKEGQNGFVVPIGDEEELASALADLVLDTDKRYRFNRFNRSLIIENGQHEFQMHKAKKIYRQLFYNQKIKTNHLQS